MHNHPKLDSNTSSACAGSFMELEPPNDYKEFLKLLNDAEVESLIVGWYAVAYHGYPRATEDIDDVRGVLAVQGIASLDIDSLQSWCDRHDTRELLEELITELDQQSAE